MLQVKIKFRLIIHKLIRTIKSQPRLKNLNLNLILPGYIIHYIFQKKSLQEYMYMYVQHEVQIQSV